MRSGEKHPERRPEPSPEHATRVEGRGEGQVEGTANDGSIPPFWYVYIIECLSGKLYTGMTNDLLRRWREHQRGGSRFTKGDPPIRMIHMEPLATRPAAGARERQIKGWTRRKKLALAAGDLGLLKRL